MAAVEDKEKYLSQVFEYYSKLKEAQNKSAYWKVLYSNFYSSIYDYLRNFIYTEANVLQDVFLQAFSDDITHIKEDDNETCKDNFELFILELIESDTKEEDLIPELKKHFKASLILPCQA